MSVAPALTREKRPAWDSEKIRADFPALHQLVHGKPLVYLDSAATTLKPQAVIDAVVRMYSEDCANVHRGAHQLSQRATQAYEGVREKVARFLNTEDRDEIVYVRGTTEAMNLVAAGWGKEFLSAGDEILLTGFEHHSTIVPWQLVAREVGAELVVVPVEDDGSVDLQAYRSRLSRRTKVVVTAHVSNTLGTVQDAKAIVSAARRLAGDGAIVMFDGAQAVPHMPVDVSDIGCDFYCFSGHKLYGPTGIGVLWGRKGLLEAMRPYQGGGDMIDQVSFEETTYNAVPHKFEAGTPHIAGVVGLGAAIDYITAIGLRAIQEHEQGLLRYGRRVLSTVPGLRLVGDTDHKVGVLSFVLDWGHHSDVGTLVDLEGVAIRTGHHCTQPLMARFGVTGTARASLGLYNREADLDALVRALESARGLLC